jgi:hypothetical protein
MIGWVEIEEKRMKLVLGMNILLTTATTEKISSTYCNLGKFYF